MSARRPMAAVLAELADGVASATAGTGLRATAIEVTLPLEVAFRLHEGETQLFADVPARVTRTAFDQRPSRLTIHWREALP